MAPRSYLARLAMPLSGAGPAVRSMPRAGADESRQRIAVAAPAPAGGPVRAATGASPHRTAREAVLPPAPLPVATAGPHRTSAPSRSRLDRQAEQPPISGDTAPPVDIAGKASATQAADALPRTTPRRPPDQPLIGAEAVSRSPAALAPPPLAAARAPSPAGAKMEVLGDAPPAPTAAPVAPA